MAIHCMYKEMKLLLQSRSTALKRRDHSTQKVKARHKALISQGALMTEGKSTS